MTELGVRPKLRFWAKIRRKQMQKNEVKGIQLLSSQTLRNGKKNMSIIGIA